MIINHYVFFFQEINICWLKKPAQFDYVGRNEKKRLSSWSLVINALFIHTWLLLSVHFLHNIFINTPALYTTTLLHLSLNFRSFYIRYNMCLHDSLNHIHNMLLHRSWSLMFVCIFFFFFLYSLFLRLLANVRFIYVKIVKEKMY